MDGDGRPATSIEAFSEEGKSPLIPGPLVRVAQGAEIHFSVRNSLRTPITFFLPSAIRGAPGGLALDSMVVAPGAVGKLTTRASSPGNYLYGATTPTTASKQLFIGGALAGAIVIDTAGAIGRPHDRVFVLMMTPDSIRAAAADTSDTVTGTVGRLVFTINGRSWPSTERIAATVGDSVHWRIINASADVHPMHLHGFYYRVDAFSGPLVEQEGQGAPGRMVVTERMSPFSAMSMTWSPDRSGNWIFHCHFALHLTPPDLKPEPHADHAMTGMVGLVLGIDVAPPPDRPGGQAVDPTLGVRRLRLVAIADKGFPDSEPSMRFVLEEHGDRIEAGTAFSPTINLTRGEPVSITVVNHLAEPTAVHWHGIELESFNDGVPGVSGSRARLAPIIAPSDSFEARFTPPRSGTFIYHSHADEVRQHNAGLIGALIVRDVGASAPLDEHVFFLKGSRQLNAASPLEVNGEANPDTVVIHAGLPARLRFISLAAFNPNATVSLTARRDSSFANLRDTMVVRWRPIAKDGADLPAAARTARLARQIVGMGETYDFEYTPGERGTLRLEVRTANLPGVLLVRVPIRVD
jgi:FtsP/CotA-like multicopper oxidase with cupredoxin domain